MVEGGDHYCQWTHGGYQWWYPDFSIQMPVSYVDRWTLYLEELPDSRERSGAPVLRFSCEGQIDVRELLSDISYLNTILDRQGLMVAAPIDLRTKTAESFSPQAPQGFWSKMEKKSQDSCDVHQLSSLNALTKFTQYIHHKRMFSCRDMLWTPWTPHCGSSVTRARNSIITVQPCSRPCCFPAILAHRSPHPGTHLVQLLLPLHRRT